MANTVYTHDCESCTYHNTLFVNDEGVVYDVYTCEAHGEKALILRYGNNPEDNYARPYNEPTSAPRWVAAKQLVELLSLAK